MSFIRAVVPMKELALAKRRLAGALADAVRRALAAAMVEDVLDTLARVRALAGTLVVTADAEVAAIARRYGAGVTDAAARDGHSAAIAAAANRLARAGEGMLTLAADVPLATPDDIERILAAQPAGERGFVIVPARDGLGSNAVLCDPANTVPLRFGAASFAPHLAAAAARGIAPVTLHLPAVALDIDGPLDLEAFLRVPSQTRARAVLDRYGIGTAPTSQT